MPLLGPHVVFFTQEFVVNFDSATLVLIHNPGLNQGRKPLGVRP